MRILMINYEYPPLGGGAGNATHHIAGQLAEMGHKVAVMTSSFRDLQTKERDRGVEIFRIPVLRRSSHRCSIVEMATFILSGLINCPEVVRRFKPDRTIAFFGIAKKTWRYSSGFFHNQLVDL